MWLTNQRRTLRVLHKPRKNSAISSATLSGVAMFHLWPASIHRIHQPKIWPPRPEKSARESSLNRSAWQNHRQTASKIHGPASPRPIDRIQIDNNHPFPLPIHRGDRSILKILTWIKGGSVIWTLTRASSRIHASTSRGLLHNSKDTT